MSGVEAVGFLLGIVPLLISTIEHYDNVLRPIRRYREFTAKSQRFHDELETQRVIFQAECQLLLGQVVGLDTAQKMLHSYGHPLWRDVGFCRRFEQRLGSLGTTCLSIISRVENALKEINQMFHNLNIDVSHSSDEANRNAYKAWASSVKKKLKFAFSEDSLRTSMKDLRSQNEIFRVISGQIVRFDGQRSQNHRQHEPLPESKRSNLRKIRMIRKVSCQLFEALGQACSAHRDHLVKFSLEARFDDSNLELNCCKIRFELAYTPLTYVQKTSTPQPSSISRGKEKEWAVETGTVEQSEDTTASTSKPLTETTWFEVESIMGSVMSSLPIQRDLGSSMSSPIAEAVDESKEQHSAKDLCIRLQSGVGEPPAATKSLIIALNNTGYCQHCIYYPSEHSSHYLSQNSTSLTELLSLTKAHPVGNFPYLYRLRIARLLGTAVLQFHNTPWLTDSWDSQCLFFNSVNPIAWGSYAPSPHLLVQVKASHQASKLTTASRASNTSAASVPNLMLFNLGIMLLELAYGVPYLNLLKSSNLEALASSQPAELAEISATYQLANNVGVFFGSGYADIVRKCLRCDFGEGEQLSNPALQERLYEDVVCRLEKMETGIRMLQGEL